MKIPIGRNYHPSRKFTSSIPLSDDTELWISTEIGASFLKCDIWVTYRTRVTVHKENKKIAVIWPGVIVLARTGTWSPADEIHHQSINILSLEERSK